MLRAPSFEEEGINQEYCIKTITIIHSLLTSPEASKLKSKKDSKVKVSTRNMNPVNVMRFGAIHVGKT